MDIEMPGMDGLTALGIIMKEMPLPVLMVSSFSTDGAKATLDALNLGAVDFIPKELSFVSLDIVKIKEELVHKVKQIVESRSLQFRLQRIRSTFQGVKGNTVTAARPSAPSTATGARRRFRSFRRIFHSGLPWCSICLRGLQNRWRNVLTA
jgi:two-component system chemotaxis response regulator CheB